MQTCQRIDSRVKYIGNYTAHECKIELSNVSSDDSGVWSCDVESYVLGATSGYRVQKELTLTIKPPTTTTTGAWCNDFSLIQSKVFRKKLKAFLSDEASCFFERNSGQNSDWNLLRIPLASAYLTKFWSKYLKDNINKDKMQPFFVHFNIVRETDGSGNLKELNKNSKSILSFSSQLLHFLDLLIQTTSSS